MYLNKNKYNSIILILILVIIPIICTSSIIGSKIFRDLHQNEKIGFNLKTSQYVEGFSVSSTLHKLFWVEGHLTLTLVANESGTITVEFTDSLNGNYFTQINEDVILMGNNEVQVVQFKFLPHITTLPGNYNFTLNITGLYNYTENFEIILGLGYVLLLLITTIFGVGVIIILTNKKGIEKPKVTILTTSDNSMSSNINEISISKIGCPECKKLINEGLTFCPECGARIPEFLRFNPNSPRGL